MPLITDPDDLNQGTLTNVSDLVFTGASGATVTVTSAGTNIPTLADNEWIEIRSANTPGNDGLYRVADATPTTGSVDLEKFTGPNPANDGSSSTDVLGTSGTSDEKSVMFDTAAKEVWLLEQGNLDSAGVTMLALHSFMKDRWKDDAFLIAAAEFPMIGISFAAGQWQIGVDPSGNNSGWKFADDNATESAYTRQLIRNAGWDEIDANGNTISKYFNVTTLGTFEDSANDTAYYWFGTDNTDTGAATDYNYAGPVNEPVRYFFEIGNPDGCDFDTTSEIDRTAGSFITDGFQVGGQVTVRNADTTGNNGTYTLTAVSALTLTVQGTPFTTGADSNAQLAVDNDNVFNTAIRIRDADPNGKTFQQADLSSAGETAVTSKIIKFPLANATDLDITETDANIDANSPYTQIDIKYFDQDFNIDVDGTTNRAFGIVVDVGTHSGVDGSTSGGSVLTTTDGGITGATYTGGTITMYDGPDEGTTFNISGTPTATTVTITGTFGTGSNQSFTLQRATPVVGSKNEIYEKVHRELRRDADINGFSPGPVVTGRTADDLAVFVGPDLRMGSFTPTNPAGGGSGVIIQGFDANDTNNLFFFDNTGTSRNYPFVAAGTFVFSQNLVDDTDGEYWLFYDYTNRTTNSDIDTVGPSGDTYDLEGTLGTYLVDDYLQISGFAQAENNGLFIVTVVNTSGSDYTVRKVDGSAVGTAETNQTVSVDENPYPSPDAIIVDNNSGSDLAGDINATSVAWDFDYENNVQGGRTADTNANVVLVAAGAETAQVAVSSNLTITKTTGQTFAVTAAQERNYST